MKVSDMKPWAETGGSYMMVLEQEEGDVRSIVPMCLRETNEQTNKQTNKQVEGNGGKWREMEGVGEREWEK